MSDSFHDAYRPENKPKGYGWWHDDNKKDYCQKIWDRGDRDWWLVYEMFRLELHSREECRSNMIEFHKDWVDEVTSRK